MDCLYAVIVVFPAFFRVIFPDSSISATDGLLLVKWVWSASAPPFIVGVKSGSPKVFLTLLSAGISIIRGGWSFNRTSSMVVLISVPPFRSVKRAVSISSRFISVSSMDAEEKRYPSGGDKASSSSVPLSNIRSVSALRFSMIFPTDAFAPISIYPSGRKRRPSTPSSALSSNTEFRKVYRMVPILTWRSSSGSVISSPT